MQMAHQCPESKEDRGGNLWLLTPPITMAYGSLMGRLRVLVSLQSWSGFLHGFCSQASSGRPVSQADLGQELVVVVAAVLLLYPGAGASATCASLLRLNTQ